MSSTHAASRCWCNMAPYPARQPREDSRSTGYLRHVLVLCCHLVRSVRAHVVWRLLRVRVGKQSGSLPRANSQHTANGGASDGHHGVSARKTSPSCELHTLDWDPWKECSDRLSLSGQWNIWANIKFESPNIDVFFSAEQNTANSPLSRGTLGYFLPRK